MALSVRTYLGLLLIVSTQFSPALVWRLPENAQQGRSSTSGVSLQQTEINFQSKNGVGRKTFVHSKALHSQTPDVASDGSSYTSWFTRLQQSIGNFIASPFMMALAISVMWLNERRNARCETLMSKGRSDVISVESDKAKPSNRDSLVYVSDGQLHGVGTLTDSRFTNGEEKPGGMVGWLPGSSAAIELTCAVKLKSVVQVYQWVETKQEEKKKDNFGGGETKKVTYSYGTTWSESMHDSKSFNQPAGHENHFTAGQAGTVETCADRVEYGTGFVLPKELVDECNDFVDASELMGCDKVAFGKHVFSKATSKETDQGKGHPSKVEEAVASYMAFLPGRMQTDTTGLTLPTSHFYWRENSQNYKGDGNPCVGDYRVAFRCVPDGPATVLALQVESGESNKSGRDTFLPYRVIERKCCGWTEEMEKAGLHTEAKKDDEELQEQDALCGGGCMLCCCCCHMVNMCLSSFARPEIFNVFHGIKSIDDCFTYLKRSNAMVTWGARIIGWILMGSSIAMFLSPLTTFLDIIPIVGWLGNMAISVISAFVTLVLTVLIITLAYLAYHPYAAIPLAFLLAALISLPFFINAKIHQA